MPYPCSNDPDEILESVVAAKNNAEKFDTFVNGGEYETVNLGGVNVPTLSNTTRLINSAAAQLDSSDVSGKFVLSTGGAEPRMLGDRFADVINVRDYGAKGDGETDDTTAINAAITAAKLRVIVRPNSDPNATGAPKIVFPHGRYVITNTLDFTWMQSCWVEFDNAVIVAGASMGVMLLFQNNWEKGNRIVGGQIDMNYNASVGVQIHGSNFCFNVQNLTIYKNGNGIGLLLGTTETSAVGDGHAHTIFDVKVYGKSGDACRYNGTGIQSNSQDYYMHDVIIYHQRRGMQLYGGGSFYQNIHIWHDNDPEDTNWNDCYGIVNPSGSNTFDYYYADGLKCGAHFGYSCRAKIQHMFYYLPKSAASAKSVSCVDCYASTRLIMDSLICNTKTNYIINPIHVLDFDASWKIYYCAKHRMHTLVDHNLTSFGGSKIYSYSVAFNAITNKSSRSPESQAASGSFPAGYYLIGHVFAVSGFIDFHIGFNGLASVDLTLRTKTDGADAFSVISKKLTNPVKTSLALGAPITVSEYGPTKLMPVYLHVYSDGVNVSPYVEVSNAIHQMFLLNMQDSMADLHDASPTIVFEQTLWEPSA